MSLKIKKFSFESVKPHRTFLICARRGSGKSTLIKDVLYNTRQNYDFCIGMCPTMESQKMLRECMPNGCVFGNYSASKIDEVVSVCKTLSSSGKSRSILLVLDDCAFDASAFRSTAIREILFNGRHMHITFIIALQYLLDLGPSLRSQIDYAICLKEPIVSNRQKLWKNLFGVFPTFEEFDAVFERCTQNFECLILNNVAQTTNPAECVYWYKAQLEIPPFRIGRGVYHDLDQKMKRTSTYVPPPDEKGSKVKLRLQVVKEEDDEGGEDSRDVVLR